MKLINSLFAAVMLLLGVMPVNGEPFDKQSTLKREVNIHQLMLSITDKARPKSTARLPRMEVPTPNHTFGPYSNFADLDGPNGELWYYTTILGSRAIEHEYYTEYVLEEYQFDIYDSHFNIVGTIHDKMRYADDEVSVPGPLSGIGILPVITKNYFNTDDKYEVAVSLAVNTTIPGYNRYRSVIYSLGGEKETVSINRNGQDETVEVDKPVAQYNAFIIDALDASTDTEENFFITFSGDVYDTTDHPNNFDYDASYWEQISTVGSSYVMYSKANDEGQLTKVFDRYLPYIQMQGDQQSTPPIITFMHDGVPYLLYPYYREPYFNTINDYYEDMTMREGNSLVLELYKLNTTSAEIFTTTEIPAVKIDGDDIIGNYYAVGSLSYSNDVRFNNEGQPVYVVTRSSYLAGQDDVSNFCYYVYDTLGNRLQTIFENADSEMSLSSIPGANEQHMFVSYNETEGYVFNMVDLTTGFNEHTTRINYLVDYGMNEPDMLLFNADRVAVGDSYKYAFEMRVPLVDDNGNTFMRIAWFNADGSLDNIDYINMGQRIQYALSYMNGSALSPHLFNNDDTHEYMILVKRALEEGSSDAQEELLVAQPTNADLTGGNTLLHLVPDAVKGSLSTIGLYPGDTTDDTRLMVGYLNPDDYSYTVDFYDLPLYDTAVEKLVPNDGANGSIAFDGTELSSNGHEIRLYNAAGSIVASGYSRLAVNQLPAGLYIAKAGVSAYKVIIK